MGDEGVLSLIPLMFSYFVFANNYNLCSIRAYGLVSYT
jgi:hypothetical protein